METGVIHFKIDAETKTRLQELAKHDERTLTNFVKKIINDYLKTRLRDEKA
jgi:predicted DNA-binding protein